MGKIVEKWWKKRRVSRWKSEGEKCAKKLYRILGVDKLGIAQGFTIDLQRVLHRGFTTVRNGVFPGFHRAYYYNYQ